MVDKVNNVNGAYEQRNAQKRPETGAPEKKEIQNIFDQLDLADGKQDGFISADIWNKYANEHGGKHIKSRIGANNAMASIEIYREREGNRIVGSEKSEANSKTEKTNEFNIPPSQYDTRSKKIAKSRADSAVNLHNKYAKSYHHNKKIDDSTGNQTNIYYDKAGNELFRKTENFKTKEVKIVLTRGQYNDGHMQRVMDGAVLIGKYDTNKKQIVITNFVDYDERGRVNFQHEYKVK